MPPKKRSLYTVEEVAVHNTAKSLWVIMNRKVYDVTVFHKRHPGGAAVLLQMGGRDATAAATAAHKTILPGNLMWEFCIGSIVRNKKPEAAPDPAKAGAGGAVVASNSVPAAPTAAGNAVPVPAANAEAQAAAVPAASATGAVPSSAPKAKAKPKPKTAVKAEIKEKTDVASHSSGSKSVQGSVDEIDSEDGSDHTDAEFAAVMDFLYERMSSDARIARWVKKSERAELMFEVRRFVSALLDGTELVRRNHAFGSAARKTSPSKHSALSARDMKEFRHRIETKFDDFVDILFNLMKRPFPLGEDVCVSNLGALSKEFWHDQQVTDFAVAVRGHLDDEALKRDSSAASIGGHSSGKHNTNGEQGQDTRPHSDDNVSPKQEASANSKPAEADPLQRRDPEAAKVFPPEQDLRLGVEPSRSTSPAPATREASEEEGACQANLICSCGS